MRDEIDGEISKTQAIRLLDIFGIGPLMIYAGMKAENDLPNWVRFGLVASGIATIGYNGMNYLDQDEVREERARRVQAILIEREASVAPAEDSSEEEKDA